MPHRVAFLPEPEVLIEVLEGSIDLEALLAMKRDEERRGWTVAPRRVLTDLRKADLRIDAEDIRKLRAYLVARLDELPERRVALLVAGPVTTALSLMFQRNSTVPGVAVFSTVEASLEWLGLTIDDVSGLWPEAHAPTRRAPSFAGRPLPDPGDDA